MDKETQIEASKIQTDLSVPKVGDVLYWSCCSK